MSLASGCFCFSSDGRSYARWGGSTIAFAAVVDVQEISQNTCVHCNYSLAANFTGYQTDQGYATGTPLYLWLAH